MRLNIDGKEIETEEGKTVLEAALQAGIYIPNLCYHPDLPPVAACRLCIVEIEGMEGFPTACTTAVKEGMVVHTNTSRVQELRKNNIWLILSEYPQKMAENSQLQKVVDWIGIKELLSGYVPHPRNFPVISDEPLFIRDPNLCVLCERCVRMCEEVRGVGAIGLINRGINTIVGTSFEAGLKDAGCKFCGACVEVCPSGALIDKEKVEEKDREQVLLPCKDACPAGIDIALYIRLVAERRFQDALEVVREKVPFPNVLGCVCTHPCEEECRRGEVNEPIAIRALKRFVAERDSGRWKSKLKIAPETGRKVAIVGSGPAGLTCAWFLRRLGHAVTVFEALPGPGGMLRAGIPQYRLPRSILNREIKDIEDIGVKIKTNTKIESLAELFKQSFEAVFLALGATEGIKMGIPGEADFRVLDGLSVLKAINLGEKVDIGKEIAVVGGGDVAIDVARSVLRLGADKVIVLYRRTQEEMPAVEEEVEYALKEGVEIRFLVMPVRVLSGRGKPPHQYPHTKTPTTNKLVWGKTFGVGEYIGGGGKLKVECIRMKLGEPDASGRPRPIPIQGSEFIIEVDRLVMAIGQRPAVPEEFGLARDKRGRLQVDEETLCSSRKGVFAGGDVVSGPASVIEGIQAGRKAAIATDKYLGGKGQIEQKFVPEEEENPWLGREDEFAYRKRAVIPVLPADKRLKGFPQIEFTLDEKAAVAEAKRCLRCQLRLRISQAPLPR